jgi:hypothetical protein
MDKKTGLVCNAATSKTRHRQEVQADVLGVVVTKSDAVLRVYTNDIQPQNNI